MSILSNKILFVISLISLKKNCNRPSKIHCLNRDGTGDLSLLRYKPDFVTRLFAKNELYCKCIDVLILYIPVYCLYFIIEVLIYILWTKSCALNLISTFLLLPLHRYFSWRTIRTACIIHPVVSASAY